MVSSRYFTVIAGSVEDDGVIDVGEFQSALGFTNSVFASRVFAALDEDGSERLEFEEFCYGFYLLSPMATREEKIQFSYKIYDVDGNGQISEEELFTLLRDVIASDTSVDIFFSDDDMRSWVASTFKDVCPEKPSMTLEDYRKMVEKHPVVLQSLTIPTNFLREFEDDKWERQFTRRVTSVTNLKNSGERKQSKAHDNGDRKQSRALK